MCNWNCTSRYPYIITSLPRCPVPPSWDLVPQQLAASTRPSTLPRWAGDILPG